MAEIVFPLNPDVDDEFTVGATTWVFDGTRWLLKPNVIQGDPGPTGPQGPVGPQGPAAPGQAAYVHNQLTASDVWTVVHNLGYYPNVSVVDSANGVVHGSVLYIDANTIELRFTVSFGGKAFCS